jgi:hypothetical protein
MANGGGAWDTKTGRVSWSWWGNGWSGLRCGCQKVEG